MAVVHYRVGWRATACRDDTRSLRRGFQTTNIAAQVTCAECQAALKDRPVEPHEAAHYAVEYVLADMQQAMGFLSYKQLADVEGTNQVLRARLWRLATDFAGGSIGGAALEFVHSSGTRYSPSGLLLCDKQGAVYKLFASHEGGIEVEWPHRGKIL